MIDRFFAHANLSPFAHVSAISGIASQFILLMLKNWPRKIADAAASFHCLFDGDNKSPKHIWQMNNHGMPCAIAAASRQTLKKSRFAAHFT
jgi:hypothetical protein